MTQASLRNVTIVVQPSFWVALVIAIIMLPLRWVTGWLIAVTIHELGHLLGIMLFRIPVYSVVIKCSGTYMQTAQMLPMQETVVAVMGPAFSLIPLIFSRWFPYLATCAFVQLLFNALPIVGFDGGRVLYGILQIFLSPDNALWVMKYILAVLLLLFVFLGVYMRWNVLVVSAVVILILRIVLITFPCKHGKQIVQ